MTKKQIAEWLKQVVLKKSSPAGITIEYFCLEPRDFQQLLKMLEEES